MSGSQILHNSNLNGIKDVFSVYPLPINTRKVRNRSEMQKYLMYEMQQEKDSPKEEEDEVVEKERADGK